MKKRSLILAALFAGAVLAVPTQANAEEKSVNDLEKELKDDKSSLDKYITDKDEEEAFKDIHYVNKKTLDGNKKEYEDYKAIVEEVGIQTANNTNLQQEIAKENNELKSSLGTDDYNSIVNEVKDKNATDLNTYIDNAQSDYNALVDHAAYAAINSSSGLDAAASALNTAANQMIEKEVAVDIATENNLTGESEADYTSTRKQEVGLAAELEAAEAAKKVAEEQKAQAELMSNSVSKLTDTTYALELIQQKKAGLEKEKAATQSAVSSAESTLKTKLGVTSLSNDLSEVAQISYEKQAGLGDNSTNRADVAKATDNYITAKLAYDSATSKLNTTIENEKILASAVEVLPSLTPTELQDLTDTINARKNRASNEISAANTTIENKTNQIAQLDSKLDGMRDSTANTAYKSAVADYNTKKATYDSIVNKDISTLTIDETDKKLLNKSGINTVSDLAAHYGKTGIYNVSSVQTEISKSTNSASTPNVSTTVKTVEAKKTIATNQKITNTLTDANKYLAAKKSRATKARDHSKAAYDSMKKKSDEMASKTTITWGSKATSNAGSGAASGTSTGRTSMNQLNTNEKAAANLAIKKSVANLNVMVSKFGQATVVDKSTFDFDSIAQSKNLVLLQALKLTTTSKDAEIDAAGMMWMQMDATAIPSNVKVYYLDKNGKLEEASVSYTKNGKVVKFRVPPKSTVAFMASVDDVVNSSNKIVDSDKITPVAKKQKLTL